MNNRTHRDVHVNIVLGNHITNIGNAFLDIGSEASIRLALPSAVIHRSSSFPTWFTEQRMNTTLLGKQYLKSSFFTMADKISCDYAVFSGMVVTGRFVRRYGHLIRRMRERGVKIVLNGAGPTGYAKEEEVAAIIEFWRKWGLHGLVTRDLFTYETFKEMSHNAYNGIDSGFFLNDALSLPRLECAEYDVLTFDAMTEPERFAFRKNVVRLHHKLYPTDKRTLKELRKPNSFISEQASDYLTIYGNAREVHSDRVHACVAAASFGKPFQLYSDSKRGLLFERVGISRSELLSSLVEVTNDTLQMEKNGQVDFIRNLMGHGIT